MYQCLAIAVKKEADESGQTHFQDAMPQQYSAREEKIPGGLQQAFRQGEHFLRAAGEIAPVLIDRPSQTGAAPVSHAGGPGFHGLLDRIVKRSDVVGQVVCHQGQRQDDQQRQRECHGERGQIRLVFQLAQQPEIDGPGRDANHGGQQHGGHEWPQHQEATRDQNDHGGKLRINFESFFHGIRPFLTR